MSIEYDFKIMGDRAIDATISCSVAQKEDIYFDKKKKMSNSKVAGFTGQVLYDDIGGEINNSSQERHSLYRHSRQLP